MRASCREQGKLTASVSCTVSERQQLVAPDGNHVCFAVQRGDRALYNRSDNTHVHRTVTVNMCEDVGQPVHRVSLPQRPT